MNWQPVLLYFVCMIFCDSTGASVEWCSHCSETDGEAWVIGSSGGVLWCMQCVNIEKRLLHLQIVL